MSWWWVPAWVAIGAAVEILLMRLFGRWRVNCKGVRP